MVTHIRLDGSFAECATGSCGLLFHLPELSVQQAEATPMTLLLPLLNAIQEPTSKAPTTDGGIAYCWENADGDFHRDYDLPAAIRTDGSMEWYRHNELHRDGDRPAIVWSDGSMEWYQEGDAHREGDLPAFISSEGDRSWYRHGKLHRDGDKPAQVDNAGQFWFKHGLRHRDSDKPAVIMSSGMLQWWENGQVTRTEYGYSEEEIQAIQRQLDATEV